MISPHPDQQTGAKRFQDATAFKALFEQSSCFAGVMSLDGVVLEANKMSLVACGYRAEEVLGKPFWDCGWWRTLPEVQEKLRKATKQVAQGTPYEETLPYVWADGSERVVDFALHPIRNEKNEIIFLHPTGNDVTERKQAEEKLVASQAQLQTVLDSITDGLAVLDTNWRYTYVSEQAADIIGMRREDLLGHCVWDIFPHLKGTMFHEGYHQAVAIGKPVHFEEFYPEPMNKWLECHCYPSLEGLSVYFRDVTERKRGEEQLFEANQRWQALMEALPVGVSYSKDATCQHITGNSALLAQVEGGSSDNISASAPDDEAHGRQIKFYQEGQPVTDADLPLQRSVAENREIAPIEFEVHLPSGKCWIMEASGAPIRDRLGKVIGGVAVTIDISERKRAEQALLEAKGHLKSYSEELEKIVESRTAKLQETIAELEHFSYAIIHDLRAPLRAMEGYADLIQEEIDSNQLELSQEYIRRIKIASRRMDQLISDSLNYSKAARQELTLGPVNLFQLLDGLVHTYPNFRSDHADVQIDTKLPIVLGNEAALTQCFSNLLGNAVKFSKPGGKPHVHVRAEATLRVSTDTSIHSFKKFVRIWIEDNGIGISQNTQQRIFELFQRGANDREGTGLGLAIVRKVVERMGGQVGVESEEGAGSRFWVDLRTLDA
jgi:PAS domain S-box-containing protein